MSLTEFPVTQSLQQCLWLFYAVILGFFYCILYELFKSFRWVIPHKASVVFFEDVLFFVICAIVFFCFSIIIDDGQVRIYCLLGTLLGSIICRSVLGRFFDGIFIKLMVFFKKIFLFVFRLIKRCVVFFKTLHRKDKINSKKKDKNTKKALKSETNV